MQQFALKSVELESIAEMLKKRNSIENGLHMDALGPGIGAGFGAPIGIASKISRPFAPKATPLIISPIGENNMLISSNIRTAISSKLPSSNSTGNGTREITSKRSLKEIKGNIIKAISRKLSKTGSRLNGKVDSRALEHREDFIFKLPPGNSSSFIRKPAQKAECRGRRNINRIRRNEILILGMCISTSGIMDLNIFSMENNKVFNHVIMKQKSGVSKSNSGIKRQINIPSDTRTFSDLRDGLTMDKELGRDTFEKKGSLRNRDIAKAESF